MRRYKVTMLLEDDGLGPNGERGMYLSLTEVKDWLVRQMCAGLEAKEFTIKELESGVQAELPTAPCVR